MKMSIIGSIKRGECCEETESEVGEHSKHERAARGEETKYTRVKTKKKCLKLKLQLNKSERIPMCSNIKKYTTCSHLLPQEVHAFAVGVERAEREYRGVPPHRSIGAVLGHGEGHRLRSEEF